jgi:spore maturation protein CgeB
MERHFTDGEHLVFYDFDDFDGLRGLIDYYLDHPAEREKIAQAGHDHVKAHHTYRDRWQSIVETLCDA